MDNRGRCLFLYLTLLYLEFWFIIAVSGGTGEGFISIDCGYENSYEDFITGLPYVSDSDFIDTGENHKIHTDMEKYVTNQQGYHLRSFPNGTRNCYRLSTERNKKYLIRAFFLYANYDQINNPPQFSIYLDGNLWSSVDLRERPTEHIFKEIMILASRNWIFVCVVNTGFGTPFISSLELRVLDDRNYPLLAHNQSLIFSNRLNIQPIKNQVLRYPNDTYDRMWMPYFSDSLETLSTTSDIAPCNGCRYPVPSDVLQTCGVPYIENGINITFQLPADIMSGEINYALHYTKVQLLTRNESRTFDLTSNMWKEYVVWSLEPRYLKIKYFEDTDNFTGNFFYLALTKADNSTLPPILSAVEIYQVKKWAELLSTNEEEVEAMMEIKEFYKLNKNWQGDPCAPKNFVWEGVECDSISSITSLNLASDGLYGEISTSLENFKQLKSLNLSNNHLQGTIPSFLAKMPNLQFLNLSGNNLTGLIPIDLQQKSNLTLSIEGNPYLCNKLDKCERSSSKKTVIAILKVVCSVIIVLLAVNV